MITSLSRRAFILQASCFGVATLSWSPENPAPRIHRLSRWRSEEAFKIFAPAFEFLEKGDVANKAAGRYPIDGDRMYATVSDLTTKPEDTAQFEAHRKYIDIHYCVRGAELIGSANASDLKEKTAYVADTDIAFYERPAKYNKLKLKPGEFAVFFTGQAHMPVCAVGAPAAMRKVVIKVLAP